MRNKHRIASRQTAVTAAAPAAPPPASAVSERAWRRAPWVAGVLVLLGVTALICYYSWRKPADRDPLAVAEEFQKLRETGQPADELLGPAPEVPSQPVPRDEADRIFADLVLRGHYRVEEVWPQDGRRVLLVCAGEDGVPQVPYRTESGVDRTPGRVADPSVLAEVRDGKLYGVRVELPAATVRDFFLLRKNANDPKALELLGPPPRVPDEPVTPQEADRLNAEFALRGNYTVERFRPEPSADGKYRRYVLSLKGSDGQPLMKVLNPKAAAGYDTVNVSLYNPDVVVEVRDGKLYAVGSRVHHDAGEKPLTPEAARRLEAPGR